MVDQAKAVCSGKSAELPRPWSSQAKSDFDNVVASFVSGGQIQAQDYVALDGTDVIEEGTWKDTTRRGVQKQRQVSL